MQLPVSASWSFASSRQSHGSAANTDGLVSFHATGKTMIGVTMIETYEMIHIGSAEAGSMHQRSGALRGCMWSCALMERLQCRSSDESVHLVT